MQTNLAQPETIDTYLAPNSDAITNYDAIISSPLPASHIGICCNKQGVNTIHFLPQQTPCYNALSRHPHSALIEQLTIELQQYFQHQGTSFTLLLDAKGTIFQHRVWQAISAIPYNETRSYGQLAHQLNSSARAIGGACRANPLPLLVPCHRVIAANGQQGGFLGQDASQAPTANIKRWLLHHEANGNSP